MTFSEYEILYNKYLKGLKTIVNMKFNTYLCFDKRKQLK